MGVGFIFVEGFVASVVSHDYGADLRLACHVRRVPPVVLPDERPRPVQSLFGYLQEVRLVQDADVLENKICAEETASSQTLTILFTAVVLAWQHSGPGTTTAVRGLLVSKVLRDNAKLDVFHGNTFTSPECECETKLIQEREAAEKSSKVCHTTRPQMYKA